MLAESAGVVHSLARDQAEQFVAALAGSSEIPLTFQTFADGDGASGAPPAIIHAPLADAWERLLDLQEYGHGCFVMVQAGDGQGRSAANVNSLRALFADDDTGAVRVTQLGLRPSIIVSSGNGAHFYWLLRQGEALGAFEAAQKAIAAKLGTDPKVCDLPRVLRLPGTYNLKDRSHPAPVELIYADASRRYSIEEVLKYLGATPIAPAGTRGLTSAGPRVLASDARSRAEAYIAKIHAVEGEGGDQATYRVAAQLLQGFGLDEATAWDLFKAWNETNASPPWTLAELGRKMVNAQRYAFNRGPVGAKLADAMSGLGGPDDPVIAAALQSPQLDPENWCCDLSLSRPWRYWRSGAWGEGITERALDRLLENEGKLTARAIAAWKKNVAVVEEAAPVYSSEERIAALPDGTKVANTFRRPTLQPAAGDWSPIERILRNLVDGDEEGYRWLVGWIAKVVQNVYAGHPARVGTAPVFTGAKGAGKGVLEEVLKALLGRHNVASISQGALDSQHNEWLDGKLLVAADEVWTSDSRAPSQIARLKNDITCHSRLINPKGRNQYSRQAVENWLIFSNNHRPVEVEAGDRRLTIFRTGGPIPVQLGAQVADDARCYGPIVRAFLRHLLTLPASALVADYRPLQTHAKDEVAAASGNSATKFAREIRERGFWSVTGAWAGIGHQGPRDLYLIDLEGYRSVQGHSPVVLRRKLMEVYKAFCAEISAPVQQEANLLAALKEALPGLVDAEVLDAGRRERVVAGLPGAFPESSPVVPLTTDAASPEDAQRLLAV